MKTQWRIVATAAIVSMALAGCAQQPPAETREPTSSSTPTATPTAQALERPANRYGLACDTLVDQATLADLFGQEQPFGLSHDVGRFGAEPLIHDGALLCEWGTPPFYGDLGVGLTVLAAPIDTRARTALNAVQESDRLVAPTAVPLGGTEAHERCSIPVPGSGAGEGHGYCKYVVMTARSVITLEINELSLESIVDVADGGPDTEGSGTLDTASPAFALLDSVVDAVVAATILPAPDPMPLADCDAIFPWDTIASDLGRTLAPVEDRDAPVDYSKPQPQPARVTKYIAARGLASAVAAEHQGVRRCAAEFLDAAGIDNTIYVDADLVPHGTWVRESGLWFGWDAETCGDVEGGRACYYAWVSPSGVAANVRITIPAQAHEDISEISAIFEKALP